MKPSAQKISRLATQLPKLSVVCWYVPLNGAEAVAEGGVHLVPLSSLRFYDEAIGILAGPRGDSIILLGSDDKKRYPKRNYNGDIWRL